MNYAEICIIKRDGKREDFSISKIKNAISKAFNATGIQDEQQLVADITRNVISQFATPTITVEEIQDLVEKALMKVRPEVAKKYIIYREWRNTERDKKTQMKHVMDGIVAIDKNDVNLSNANMSSHTPAGQMMTFASEVTKDYTYKYLLPKRFAEAHQLGDIHIHDLDYYPTKTTTCIQYDMDDLFERGFRTKNGSIRTPQSIQSYATLATIIFQTNQNEQVGDVLRSGTLGIGFIGGHNAMMALYGEGHGHSRKAWDTLYEAVMEMNKVVDEYKAKYNLNYSVLATPAEGLSGRFTKMDRRKYGKIPGVTDRDYYVNSFHVDVKEQISIVEKIKCEAPFHAITRGGHITYVELDGEAQKNVRAIAKIVKVMHDEGIGYGSINHPVDTCHNCGYKGVIFDKCPVCQSESILRMRRITGYLTGDLSSWNSAKRAEEKDRVKNL